MGCEGFVAEFDGGERETEVGCSMPDQECLQELDTARS